MEKTRALKLVNSVQNPSYSCSTVRESVSNFYHIFILYYYNIKMHFVVDNIEQIINF